MIASTFGAGDAGMAGRREGGGSADVAERADQRDGGAQAARVLSTVRGGSRPMRTTTLRGPDLRLRLEGLPFHSTARPWTMADRPMDTRARPPGMTPP